MLFAVRFSFNFPTLAFTPFTVRFNFTAMVMTDASDASRDLSRSSSSVVHILLVLTGTLDHPHELFASRNA